MKLFLIDLEY